MTRVFGGLLTVGVLLTCHAAAHAGSLGLTGWNHDIILSTTETPPAGYTRHVSAWTFYEQGFPSGTQGLPANSGAEPRTFTSLASPAVKFQFQPYTANNALVLDTNQTATLTLTTPGQYSSIQFLNTAQGASGISWNAKLNFSDGSSFTSSSYADPDWTGSHPSGTALTHYGLRNVSGSFFTGSLYLVEHDLILSGADRLKVLESITFSQTGGNTLMLFAVNGDATVPEPSTIALLGLGLVAAVFLRRQRRRA